MTGLSGRHDLARSPKAASLGSAGRGKHGAAHEVARHRCRRHLHRPRSLRTKSAAGSSSTKCRARRSTRRRACTPGPRGSTSISPSSCMARPLRPPRSSREGRPHRGADDRRISRRARGPAESGRASRPEHDEAVRSAWIQPGKGGVAFLRRLNFRSRPAGTIPKGAENSRAIVRIYG